MVLSNGTGVKGARVDSAATSISGEELGEGCVEVVKDKGGNDVLIAVGDDKKVTRTNGIKVVLPTRAREYTWLRACRARSMSLCVSVPCFSLQRFGFSLLV